MKRLLILLWVLPTSLIGILAAIIWLSFGARARFSHGVLEVHGGSLAKWVMKRGFAAMTLGHVILGFSSTTLDRLRPHEHVHVKQAERWGILFIPAYLLAGLWQAVKGRHVYYDNPFELEAFAADALTVSQASNKKAP